jgi:anaerobic magnesium-protoporphyrin IX monomethyl ester cyclase
MSEPLKVAIVITRSTFHTYLVPLGYAYVFSTLKKSGYDLRLFDYSASPQSLDQSFLKDFNAFRPQVVITGTSYRFHNNCPSPTVHSAVDVCKRTKGLDPVCTTLLIGPLNSMIGEKLILDPHVNAVAVGEPELICDLFCDAVDKGKSLEDVSGIFLETGGKVHKTPDAPYPSLDKLSPPDREAIYIERFIQDTYFAKRSTEILTTRGCPINCSFCFGARDSKRNQFNTGPYYRRVPPNQVVEEVDLLYHKWGVRGIKFVDIEFCISKNHVTEICNLLLARNYKDLHWRAVTRVTSLDADLLELMYEAGCRSIYYGVESGDEKILRSMGKDITLDQVRETLDLTWKAGIKPEASFLLGVHGDNEETIERTIRFACELNPFLATFHSFMPYPGILMEDSFDHIPYVDLDQWNVYEQKVQQSYCDVSPEKLVRLVKSAYRRFYFRPAYLMRFLKSLDSNMIQFVLGAVKGSNEGGIVRNLFFKNNFRKNKKKLARKNETLSLPV